MTFRSKVDWWYYAIAVGVLGQVGYTAYRTHHLLPPYVLALMVLGGLLPVWLLVTTYYRVDRESLKIRSGTIRLDEIRSVQASRSLLSPPALSADRLRISYGGSKNLR